MNFLCKICVCCEQNVEKFLVGHRLSRLRAIPLAFFDVLRDTAHMKKNRQKMILKKKCEIFD